jgi:hypothetical protein
MDGSTIDDRSTPHPPRSYPFFRTSGVLARACHVTSQVRLGPANTTFMQYCCTLKSSIPVSAQKWKHNDFVETVILPFIISLEEALD